MATLLPFGFSNNFALDSRHDYALYVLYLVATILGGLIGSYLAFPSTLELPRWRGFASAAVIYVGIVVGAVSLLGVTPLKLPNVQFDSRARVKEGSLLAHSEGYWYVLTDKEILAIPDDTGGEIRITEPLPYGPHPTTERP
jgi:MFS family permease